MLIGLFLGLTGCAGLGLDSKTAADEFTALAEARLAMAEEAAEGKTKAKLALARQLLDIYRRVEDGEVSREDAKAALDAAFDAFELAEGEKQ